MNAVKFSEAALNNQGAGIDFLFAKKQIDSIILDVKHTIRPVHLARISRMFKALGFLGGSRMSDDDLPSRMTASRQA